MRILLIIYLIFSFLWSASGSDLMDKGRRYNGKVIKYSGEVIGEPLHRKSGSWLNILGSDGIAIGVYLPKEEADKVKIFGNYSHRGDEVEVIGVFNRIDLKNNGETMIRASTLKLVTPGYTIIHSVSRTKLIFAGVLSLISLILGLLLIIIKQQKSNQQ